MPPPMPKEKARKDLNKMFNVLPRDQPPTGKKPASAPPSLATMPTTERTQLRRLDPSKVPSPSTAARNRGQRRVSFAGYMMPTPAPATRVQRRLDNDTLCNADDEQTITTVIDYDDKRI